jgi:DNA-directed RNA polymerase specialized sigma24 family protein
METQKHYKQLDYQDRLAIALGKEQGLSIRAIARILDRSASTISRELELELDLPRSHGQFRDFGSRLYFAFN